MTGQRIATDLLISGTGWQAFERTVMRLALVRDFSHVRLAGTSGDGGADVTCTKNGRRWLFQVKRWQSAVGTDVVAETLEACRKYDAEIPVIVSRRGFTPAVRTQQAKLASKGVHLQLWDRPTLLRQADLCRDEPLTQSRPDEFELRSYQSEAVDKLMADFLAGARSGLVVLATGLGKTYVAGDFYRRFSALRPGGKTLVLAHRNELVYQLERALWPSLRASQSTGIWNGAECPDPEVLGRLDVVFACVDSVAAATGERAAIASRFDLVIVDECHHLGTSDYDKVLEGVSAGTGGAFLVGMTATPWRPDGSPLRKWFDRPVVDIDLVRGLKEGFLANVDYRMYTDNIRWEAIHDLHGGSFTPRGVNRTLFIDEWDDAVVDRLSEAWSEQDDPKAIVFCGTIDHSLQMAARVNALGFTRAAAIHSGASSPKLKALDPVTRNSMLWDFAEGRIGVLCAVDILNEGVDLPDVSIVVFQRVTHSRRIFIQQLGRGLRISPTKKRVIVLDFVSDIRRVAAGLDLQTSLEQDARVQGARIRLGSRVSFRRQNGTDERGAEFLREWLGDLREVEESGEDVHILRYPPATGRAPSGRERRP